MADSKAQKRIRDKNKRRRSKKEAKAPSETTEAPESTPVVPTGPEPKGMKERVKRGFLSERDALTLLAESPTTVSPKVEGWLRRRL